MARSLTERHADRLINEAKSAAEGDETVKEKLENPGEHIENYADQMQRELPVKKEDLLEVALKRLGD